jgi:transposase
MTYPLKFREKVFSVKEKQGLTFEQTSERFDIPIRTLFRWTNQLKPKTTRNKPATKVPMELLVEDVEKQPDAYLKERAERFNVSTTAIHYALKRLGISYKKNSKTSESQ